MGRKKEKVEKVGAVGGAPSCLSVRKLNKLWVGVAGRQEIPSDQDIARVKESFDNNTLFRLLTEKGTKKLKKKKGCFVKKGTKKKVVSAIGDTSRSVADVISAEKERMRRSSVEMYTFFDPVLCSIDNIEDVNGSRNNVKDKAARKSGISKDLKTEKLVMISSGGSRGEASSKDGGNAQEDDVEMVDDDDNVDSQQSSESKSTSETETISDDDDEEYEDVFEETEKIERFERNQVLSLSLAIGKYEEDSDDEWEDIVNEHKVKAGNNRGLRNRNLAKVSKSRPDGKEIDDWIPTEEERKAMYCNNSFVIRAVDAKKDPLDTILWKLYDAGNDARDVTLAKFVPEALNGRVVHVHRRCGREACKKIVVPKNILFQIYRPVIDITLTNSPEVIVVRYLKIPKIFRYIPRLRLDSQEEKDAICCDMQCVVRLIAYSISSRTSFEMFGLEILNNEEDYRQRWDRIEEMVSSRLLKFKCLFKGNDKVVEAVELCRSMKFQRLDHKTECEKPCESCETNRIFYKATGTVQPYNKFSFKDNKSHPSFGTVKEAKVCYSCGQMLKAVGQLVHFKWYLYASIRIQITDYLGELDEVQILVRNEMARFVSDRMEWSDQTALEFLVAAYAVDKEISRLKTLQKATKDTTQGIVTCLSAQVPSYFNEKPSATQVPYLTSL